MYLPKQLRRFSVRSIRLQLCWIKGSGCFRAHYVVRDASTSLIRDGFYQLFQQFINTYIRKCIHYLFLCILSMTMQLMSSYYMSALSHVFIKILGLENRSIVSLFWTGNAFGWSFILMKVYVSIETCGCLSYSSRGHPCSYIPCISTRWRE